MLNISNGRLLLFSLVMCLCRCLQAGTESLAWSMARVWDEEILAAIRIDLPHPPVHARNLFHLSACMYDAWAAYDPVAIGYLYRDKHTAADKAAARREAVSYAAYRLLAERYLFSRNAFTTATALDARMAALGYDKNNLTLDTASPAGVGNRVAAAVSAFFLYDGALQTQAYRDLLASQGGYVSVNLPLITGTRGTFASDVNRWQPLVITNAVSQNNIPVDAIQKFLGAQWLQVRPFSLARSDSTLPWFDPGSPPRLGGAGDGQFRDEVVETIRRSSELTPDDGVMMDISPGAFGNSDLGTNNGKGHSINPITGLPYAANVVKRGDFARVLAEYWADGPNSETPPGHWNSVANAVTDHPLFSRQLGGQGAVLDKLEWDVKLYFALNSALHDAACAAWSLKRYYDGGRPIEMIRFMGQLGQSSDPAAPIFHKNGLPLVPGLIEVVTVSSSVPGQRHAGLRVNTVAILAWPGQPQNPTNQHSGVRWIVAADWMPYQKKTFVTPAFPGYVSGHSTFSRAGAEVLAAITGSPHFPGGIASHTVSSLGFEEGPSSPVQLQWGTYFDAADQAGLSRLWGGIHVPVDDLTGRRIGSQVGRNAWELARQYFDGSLAASPVFATIHVLDSMRCEVRFSTMRGLYYKLQSTPDLSQPFVDEPGGFMQALDAQMSISPVADSGRKFFRAVRSLKPQG